MNNQPNPELKPDMLRVEVADGKYTVVQDSTGKLFALRYGEPWRECVGDNLIYCLAAELQELRNTRATPPVHILEDARELVNELEKIRAISCGEAQVADDDTEAMRFIFSSAKYALATPLAQRLADAINAKNHAPV